MKTRIISGVFLVLILFVVLFFGGNVLLVATMAVSVIGSFELFRVFDFEKKAPAIIVYVAEIVYFLDLKLNFIPNFAILLLALFIALMVSFVAMYPKLSASQLMAAPFGFVYVAMMLSCVYLTRELPLGAYLVWLIFICSWVADTCAYFVGSKFGKRKIAPVLSPKKSLEGAIGGIVGAGVLGGIFGAVFMNALSLSVGQVFALVGICAAGGFFSIFGDLAASAIKRNYDIKDYGKLIPGHGGILDRFDSVIIISPVVYFACLYLF